VFKKSLSILLVVLLTTWQGQAIAKGGVKGSSGKSFSATSRPNPHGSQGTGSWKGKRDKHEKPSPQNEKKKKLSKWLHLKR
jgi:hypothetical protein